MCESMQGGSTISASAPPNTAVTVLLNRTVGCMERMGILNDFLLVRAYASHVEAEVCKDF